MNAKWETLKFCYCFRILTIAHKILFLNMHLVNRLVVSKPCNYNLRKTLNVIVSRPRIELGHSQTLIHAQNCNSFELIVRLCQTV